MADQPAQLAAWQAARREDKRERVRAAIRRLDARGARITFAAVADEARVNRSFVYSHEDLAEEVKRLREESAGPLKPRPRRERASAASLHVRLCAAQQTNAEQRVEIKRLREENRALRDELSRLRGERWENVA
jgi:hypothetical protein